MEFIEYTLVSYFGYCVLYTFIFSVAGTFGKKIKGPPPQEQARYNKIAVLIPAYKEDGVIVTVTKEALAQDYPSEHFDVIIIGDRLRTKTFDKLRELPAKVIEARFKNSTKSKALNKALAEIKDDYDIALVLDADNIMEQGYLRKLNTVFNNGYKAVQTNRKAKNENTSFAILDALSEVLNNHIYKKGHTAMGMSSSLTGSGMAFDYRIFKSAMKKINAVGGFDRELEYLLLKEGHKVVYFEDIVVYDEKTENAKVFSTQRKRWISSQFYYLGKYFVKGLKGNLVYLNSTVLRNLLLPRLILMGTLFILGAVTTVLGRFLPVHPVLWWALWVLYMLSLILAIPMGFYNKKLLKAIVYIPRTFFIMVAIMFRLKGANKNFIHTPHGQTNA